jgi:glycosyltransferase involved in cell wall biosynthesis
MKGQSVFMAYPKISLLMPVFNEEDIIENSLNHISNNLEYPNLEILLAIDGDDKSVEIARKFAKKDGRIKIDYSKERRGAFAAQNILLKKATGDIIVKFDTDSRFVEPKKAFFNLVKHYKNPKVGAILFDHGYANQEEGSRSLTAKGEVFVMRLVSDYMKSKGTVRGSSNNFLVVSSFRNGIINKIDPDCPEDAEFAYTALEKGYEIIFASDVKVYKIGNPANPKSLFRQKKRNTKFWFGMKKKRNIRLYPFYMVVMIYFLRNFYKYKISDIVAFFYWCIVFSTAVVSARFQRSDGKLDKWTKHKRV